MREFNIDCRCFLVLKLNSTINTVYGIKGLFSPGYEYENNIYITTSTVYYMYIYEHVSILVQED